MSINNGPEITILLQKFVMILESAWKKQKHFYKWLNKTNTKLQINEYKLNSISNKKYQNNSINLFKMYSNQNTFILFLL